MKKALALHHLLLFVVWFVILYTIICMLNMDAFADAHNSGDFGYEVQNDGTCIITSYTGNDVRIDIPQTLDGHRVIAIGDNAFSQDSFKRSESHIISLPDGIVTIGNFAFFQSNASYINIPSSVKSIGIGAFAGCPMCKFAIEGSHPYYAVIDNCLYSKKDKMLIAAIMEYEGLSTLNIPEGIVKIGDCACYRYDFYKVDNDQYRRGFQLRIPNSLREIGNYAFTDCKIRISPDAFSNITSIGNYAFSKGCIVTSADDYEELFFSDDLSYLGEGVFQGFGGYNPITLNFSQCKLNHIPNNAFADTSFVRVKLPESLVSIGSRAFASFEGQDIKMYRMGPPMIPRGVIEIGESCYENAVPYYLSEFTIPGSVLVLPRRSFKGMQTVSSSVVIIIEEGVKRIESEALAISSRRRGKDGTMKVYLPKSVEYIADNAMTKEFALTFYVIKDSYAERWCIKNNVTAQ